MTIRPQLAPIHHRRRVPTGSRRTDGARWTCQRCSVRERSEPGSTRLPAGWTFVAGGLPVCPSCTRTADQEER